MVFSAPKTRVFWLSQIDMSQERMQLSELSLQLVNQILARRLGAWRLPRDHFWITFGYVQFRSINIQIRSIHGRHFLCVVNESCPWLSFVNEIGAICWAVSSYSATRHVAVGCSKAEGPSFQKCSEGPAKPTFQPAKDFPFVARCSLCLQRIIYHAIFKRPSDNMQ